MTELVLKETPSDIANVRNQIVSITRREGSSGRSKTRIHIRKVNAEDQILSGTSYSPSEYEALFGPLPET